MATTQEQREERVTRRGVLRVTAAAGAGALLAACGGSSDEAGDPAGSATGNDTSNGPKQDGGSDGGGQVLAKTSEVPAGSGVILEDAKVVVTQPTEGDFKAFSGICTHRGCLVSSVKGKTINCQCHGSAFDVEDGSVVNGPAQRPLREIEVKVEGDSVVRA